MGSFRCKPWIYSSAEQGEVNLVKKENTDDHKVLGKKWNPRSDTFRFVIRINFAAIGRNIRTGADMSKDQVKELNPLSFTKREIYSQVYSI